MDGLPLSPSSSPSPVPPPGMKIRTPVFPNVSGTPSEFDPNTSGDQAADVKTRMKNRRPTSPKELISYYESQGMSREEASIRIISELQNVVFKVVTSRPGKTETAPLDVVNSRLMKLESKLDSKPGYGQTLAIGIAAGSVVQGFGHVSSAFAQIWSFVSKAASGKP